MIFTVIQYLPLLEEEVHGARIELAKKDTSSDGNDGMNDQNDSDNDDDTESDIFLNGIFQSTYINSQALTLFERSALKYSFQLPSIQSPPPKA